MAEPAKLRNPRTDPEQIVARLMKHAFLSAIVAARNTPAHEEIYGTKLWAQYEPEPVDFERWQAVLKELQEGTAA